MIYCRALPLASLCPPCIVRCQTHSIPDLRAPLNIPAGFPGRLRCNASEFFGLQCSASGLALVRVFFKGPVLLQQSSMLPSFCEIDPSLDTLNP